MHLTFTLFSQSCCLLLTPKHPPFHLHTVTTAHREHNQGVLHVVGFPWPCAQQCVEAPPPRHLARWQTNITAAAGGGEEGGRKAWGTLGHLLSLPVTSEKELWWSSERHSPNYPALFLLQRRVFTCTYAQKHAWRFEAVCVCTCVCAKKTGWVRCIHLNIHYYKNKLTVGVHNRILFFSSSEECADIKRTIPAFDHVTHWWYRNHCNRYTLLQHVQYSNEPLWFNLTFVT